MARSRRRLHPRVRRERQKAYNNASSVIIYHGVNFQSFRIFLPTKLERPMDQKNEKKNEEKTNFTNLHSSSSCTVAFFIYSSFIAARLVVYNQYTPDHILTPGITSCLIHVHWRARGWILSNRRIVTTTRTVTQTCRTTKRSITT